MLMLIVNPVAGGGYAGRVAQQIETELIKKGIPCRIYATTAPGHATDLARAAAKEQECTGILSIGGDGTAFEVASGVAGTGIPMGIIPAGTGNDFIKSVHLPKDPMQALGFILSHDPRPVDIVRLNDRNYLNVSGLGFDVTVLEQAESLRGKLKGMLPYLIGVIRTIFIYKPIHVKIEADGEITEDDVLICSVANGQYIGGGIHICPAAKVDDGLLDLVTVKAVPRWQIPKYLPGLLSGKVLSFPITTHRVARKSLNMKVQIDGEIYQMNSASFEIHPSAFMLYW